MIFVETLERTAEARPTLSHRFSDAVAWASDLHRHQRRKGSDTPYAAHLLSVCALVLENGGAEDEAIAALLHDAVEDCGGRPTADEIRSRFGARVADIVDGCTDSDETPKPAWRPRKERFIERLEHASDSVRLVCAADKLHNARSVLADWRREGDRVWDRFAAPRDETLWYYRGDEPPPGERARRPRGRARSRGDGAGTHAVGRG